jgi:voltage-gated potassium channel
MNYLPLGGFGTKRLVRGLQTGRVLPALFVTMLGLIFAFAAVMRIVDSESFPTYGTALWWSVSTVTTVGYGDVVPHQPFGRLVAGALMVLGFAFLSLVTGTIASALVSRFTADQQSTLMVDAIDRLERRIAELEKRVG